MRVREILECCLYAENLAETAAWYARVLGLAPFSQSHDRHVFFRVGNRCFFLFDPTATRDASRTKTDVPTHGAGGEGHVCFAIGADEVDAWRERLGDLVVPIEREITWPNGARSIYVRDPARNSVELATPSLWNITESDCFSTRSGS
ncbi:MAG: VOC family protein [Phycisphaerales bacterium]|nr:VOC family protein [Phycisphaerales bacterium]